MFENSSLLLDKGDTVKRSNFILRLRGGSSTTTQPPRPINIDYAMLLVNTLGLAAAAAQLGVVPSNFCYWRLFPIQRVLAYFEMHITQGDYLSLLAFLLRVLTTDFDG
ncbi:hypothetical protein EV368DRAFT_65350 [Lentinula lateritia]|nr:hypothetical protein EV368DRAFT_65350 [Lentinula lateritia]